MLMNIFVQEIQLTLALRVVQQSETKPKPRSKTAINIKYSSMKLFFVVVAHSQLALALSILSSVYHNFLTSYKSQKQKYGELNLCFSEHEEKLSKKKKQLRTTLKI